MIIPEKNEITKNNDQLQTKNVNSLIKKRLYIATGALHMYLKYRQKVARVKELSRSLYEMSNIAIFSS